MPLVFNSTANIIYKRCIFVSGLNAKAGSGLQSGFTRFSTGLAQKAGIEFSLIGLLHG